MGNRPSRRARPPRQIYNQIPRQQVPIVPAQPMIPPPTMGNIMGQKTMPYPQQPCDSIQNYYYDPRGYEDVVGSDSGNMTVFSWITQITTCCATTCTLVVLIAFVIWMYLNRNINTLP